VVLKVKWLILCVVCGVTTGALAVEPSKILEKSRSSLEYVTLEVNGQPQKVAADKELVVVSGDEVIIKSAVLFDPKVSASNVNLVGFIPNSEKRPAEDRGFKIHTSRDLLKKWAINEEGNLYRIEAFSGNEKHGSAFLRVLKPVLKYVEVSVNGEQKLIREGDLLTVKASDNFKVKNVVSNIENDREAVSFQVIQVNPELDLSGRKFYELRFSRNKRIFAKIPMQVVEGT